MRKIGWIIGAILIASACVAGAAEIGVAAHATDTAACRPMTFEGDGYTVCRYDPKLDEVRLAWRGAGGPLGGLAALQAWLGPDAGRVAFAMNAGMYDEAQSPVGLYVADGRALRPLNRAAGSGNFFLAPNGVFWVDDGGGAHVDETSGFAARGVHPRWATQSGPLLLKAGALHPAIMPDGASRFVRNAVGVRGGEALFVISDEPVSFGRLARLFRDGLGCTDALYLDGSISSLWAPELSRRDGRTGLGTFVVVMRRQAG
jgi:uncharacterized protein YigE (DUF2233 family)